MRSDPCVEKIKRENLIKLSIFFTCINVVDILCKNCETILVIGPLALF